MTRSTRSQAPSLVRELLVADPLTDEEIEAVRANARGARVVVKQTVQRLLATIDALRVTLAAEREGYADANRVCNEAFTAIAKLSGCKSWDYPAQVARDAEMVAQKVARLERVAEVARAIRGRVNVLDPGMRHTALFDPLIDAFRALDGGDDG